MVSSRNFFPKVYLSHIIAKRLLIKQKITGSTKGEAPHEHHAKLARRNFSHTREKHVLPPSKIINRFYFSGYIDFTIYIDITYI